MVTSPSFWSQPIIAAAPKHNPPLSPTLPPPVSTPQLAVRSAQKEVQSTKPSAPLSKRTFPRISPDLSRRKVAIIVTMIVIVLLITSGGFLYGQIIGSKANLQPAVSPTASLSATQEAIYAAATADTIAANPYPSYLPGKGTLAFYDPLSDNTLHNNWYETGYGISSCTFDQGSYQAFGSHPIDNTFCTAGYTDFSDFAFEVQLTIIYGDCGGLIFRGDSTKNTYYVFEVCQNGSFDLYVYRGAPGSYLIKPVINSAINTGNQSNIVAVVAKSNNIKLYINQKPIASVSDNTYSHGQIGFVADLFRVSGHATKVSYSNAKIWTF